MAFKRMNELEQDFQEAMATFLLSWNDRLHALTLMGIAAQVVAIGAYNSAPSEADARLLLTKNMDLGIERAQKDGGENAQNTNE